MGNLFEWESPPAEATWNFFVIKRATSLTGTYSTIATIAAKDSDGYWVTKYWDEAGTTTNYYKVQPYNSSSGLYGSDSDPVTVTNITTSYTSIAKIAGLMQVKIGGDTKPAVSDVLDLIQRTEDDIDYVTGHSWRTRFSQSQRGDDTSSSAWETHYLNADYKVAAGIPIKLEHRMVRDLSAAAGDALEVWDGNQYTDYLTTRTQGRNSDWWLQNNEGKLYIRDMIRSAIEETVRIKYRYGETSVPGDIQELATKKVAIELAVSNDRSYLIPTGGDAVKLDAKVKIWQDRVAEILAQRTEWRNIRY